MLAIALFSIGFIARFVVEIPNFTPVLAIALFAGVYLPRKWAIVLPMAVLAISDAFLGFHSTMLFTWLSVILISLTGIWLKGRKSSANIFGTSLASVFIFFFISNLGVWLTSGLYTMDIAGLVKCFTMAVPFIRAMLASTLIYTFVLFGLYELFALKLRNTKYAFVLS